MEKENQSSLFYGNRINELKQKFLSLKKKIGVASTFRIIVFLLTILGIYLTAGKNADLLIAIAIAGTFVFILLVIRHTRLYKKKEWNDLLLAINEKELNLLNGIFYDTDVVSFSKKLNHPFVDDLDVFGNKSLFQLFDRSATKQGQKKLIDTFRNPLQHKEILKQRQQAISELKEKIIWRQEFQATGKKNISQNLNINTVFSNPELQEKTFNRLLFKILIFINSALGLSVLTLVSIGILNFVWLIYFFALPMIILGVNHKKLNIRYSLLGKQADSTSQYAKLFHQIELISFNSELLKRLKNILTGKKNSAYAAFKHLAAISKAFDYRLNMIVGLILNAFFLWDFIQVIRMEKWHSKFGTEVESWIDALSSIDELSSIAGFAFNYPQAIFPQIASDNLKLKGKNLCHPFLINKKCVGNPVEVLGWQQFQIITGANMAGKSTYLRTVGVNLLLAMTGSPVLADEFIFTPVQLFTGIKTSDSLQEGASYFFAELSRLHEIIQRLEKGEKLFVILDEVLRGTNSKDKQYGSKNLLKKLIKLGASGLIATHDLALGDLKNDFPENIVNKRFEVEIKNNQMVFDYKLKNGISQNLNATFLMKEMGIIDE